MKLLNFKYKIMKKTAVLILFVLLSIGVLIQAQETKEKSPMQKLIEENNIPKQKYEKFWVILERNYITYHPDEKWNVVSDSLSPVCTDDKCYIKNVLGLQDGKLSYKDGKCMIAVGAAFKPGKKIPNPYEYEEAREYIFSRVSNYFEWGKKFRSLSKQDLKDVEMLVKDYPAETAQSIFNGKSMFIYPLNFKGEYCQEKYRYGRGVVVLGKYNIPLYLYFFMTDESLVDFDKYLSELKGLFWFEDIENV